jgi:hypothetical protein
MTKKLAILFGAVFVLVGVLGFIPNPIVGAGALFEANMAHNVVHLVVGIALLAVASKETSAGLAMKVFGIVYLLVAALGFFMGSGMLLGILYVNSADNWLHVVLGVALLAAGFSGGKAAAVPAVSGGIPGRPA